MSEGPYPETADECKFCTYNRHVRGVIERRDVDELIATVHELRDAELHASGDVDYYRCILNGSWPSAVEILTEALEKARAIRAKERAEKMVVPRETAR